MDRELMERFEQAIREDGRYPLEAYQFLHEGLRTATRHKYGDAPKRRPQHVSGQELCLAMRYLAISTWGPLAHEVLRRWNIRRTRDFGEMVYVMIKLGFMGKQDSDELADFDDVYGFQEAFAGYHIQLNATD